MIKSNEDEKEIKQEIKENINVKNKAIEERTNLNVNFDKKVKNLRSINIEKTNLKINDIQINTISENDLIKCRIAIISHWKNLCGRIPNEFIIEASMDWFSKRYMAKY